MHRFSIRYAERPGPNQILSLHAGNVSYEHNIAPGLHQKNLTLTANYQLKFSPWARLKRWRFTQRTHARIRLIHREMTNLSLIKKAETGRLVAKVEFAKVPSAFVVEELQGRAKASMNKLETMNRSALFLAGSAD